MLDLLAWEAIVTDVRRALKKLALLTFLVWTLGFWCASYASVGTVVFAGQLGHSNSGCGQRTTAVEAEGCEGSGFLCPFVPGWSSKAALVSPRSPESSKAASLVGGDFLDVGSTYRMRPLAVAAYSGFPHRPALAVSLHLFHSVLTL